jgi:REP element-mobilizing transposase RayT
MPRPPRLNVAGGVYHITARGNNFEPIFLDDADRYVYLRMLASVSTQLSIRLFAYVLMTNHVHLLWETAHPNLSAAVHRLHGPYARYFNHRHEHWGHVFGQRFYGELITEDDHLLALSQYIPRNPVRAGLVDDPADYPWSSYPWYVGLTENSLVDARPVLELLTRNPDRVPMEFVQALREPVRR